MDQCTKIILSEKVFLSIIVTIAKAVDRLCLNAKCSLVTTTWRTYFLMRIRFLLFAVVIGSINIFKIIEITLFSQSRQLHRTDTLFGRWTITGSRAWEVISPESTGRS